tara:strand:+ start:527 stop:769 length:243 start_codon:yes stop_codon:yes gene_type:complete
MPNKKGYDKITEIKRDHYINDERAGYWRSKLHPQLNAYFYTDEEGNKKPTTFCMRWNDFGDDYLGYADEEGDECMIRFID